MIRPSALLLCTALTLATFAAGAAEPRMEWPLCHTFTSYQAPSEQIDSATAPTEITADYGEGVGSELYTVRGNVFVRRGGQELTADHAVYDDRTGLVDATGAVLFRHRGLIVEGEAAHFDLSTETGQVERTHYQYLERHAHGDAGTLVRESADITQLYRASYTTCDADHLDWELRARRVTLNHATAVGVARDVTVRFKNVPLFYLPYINFPLNDDRKTGLLPPTIGYSNLSGFELGVPFYWNIAPDRDATITPRLLANRGLLTQLEFRYLNPDNAGRITADYLPGDAIYGGDRGAFSLQHQHTLSARWHADANFNYVSDAHYLGQLGSGLTSASTTHLDRRLDLNYTGDHNQFLARVQDYQTIDPTIAPADRPYRRLPQLQFVGNAPAHPLGADYGVQAEFVRFERDGSLTGSRINLQPAIAWPQESLSYFVIPKIGLNYTGYYLDGVTAGGEAAPGHTTPVLSLDSGIFLERELELRGLPYVHTLEPRLYYLRIPYRDQSDFPVFDASRYDFSYSQLFRENRYTTADRLGDANQISAGVTSRLLERDSGREWLRAALGQIYYFETPRVTLPGEVTPVRGESDIVAELGARFTTAWTATGYLQWNPDEQIQKGGVQFHYQSDAGHIFNAGYRFRTDDIDQTDFSVLWPLQRQWRLVGRWNYSYRDYRSLETLAGVQYDSCCWAFRITSRRYINSIEGNSSQALYFQLELKGLAAVGHSVEEVLEHGILGYRAH